MLKNKNNIFFSFDNFDTIENFYLTKYCEWKDCEEKGEYRAPSSRENLREFRWFCLDHVKIYNKSWDYFKGKTADEIYNEISKDATWHRPTSKRSRSFRFQDNFSFFKKEKKAFKEKHTNLQEDNIFIALSILDMQMPESIDILKKQYKKLVKKFHPDINKEKDKEYIVKLNEAYATLLKLFKS